MAVCAPAPHPGTSPPKFTAWRIDWSTPATCCAAPKEVLLVLTVPATMGFFALLIYAFFIMPWWQPIVGFALALRALLS